MRKKRTEGRIKAHYGMRDYYKDYKKNAENPVEHNVYTDIISEFNLAIIDAMFNKGIDYKFPLLDLFLTIRKDKRKPVIKDGKLYNNVPMDFKKTMALWERDEEAREKKIKVRYTNAHSSGYVFRIYLRKFASGLKNKSSYKFKPCRSFQRGLAARIMDDDKDKFDAYLLHSKK
jgi:hypothetical protein